MKKISQGLYVGERALYHTVDAEIENATFADGESPLKESRNLKLHNCIFKWKYPLWYCEHVQVENTSLLETARSGIWYTYDITMRHCAIEAPKTFRRASHIVLEDVNIPNAQETLWNCKNIQLKKVNAQGDYFGLNAENVVIHDFHLTGNYAFDGGKNIEIHNAVMLSKDSFWNCENVTVYDSTIVGEYLGWNSKNITFVRCTIDSMQGMCYMDNVKLVHCKLLNTNLAFEFCTVDALIDSEIDSVKNPIAGKIHAKKIHEIILDPQYIDPKKTEITEEEKHEETI